MRQIDKAILHYSESGVSYHDNIATMKKWHTSPPRNYSDVAYHFYISQEGKVEFGRDIETIGAHCYGQNGTSIGICLGGKDTFTEIQFESCRKLLRILKKSYPEMTIHGHCEFSDKVCPNFDYQKEIIDKL